MLTFYSKKPFLFAAGHKSLADSILSQYMTSLLSKAQLQMYPEQCGQKLEIRKSTNKFFFATVNKCFK